MLILKLTSPEGAVKFVGGAFPSACGMNLAMLVPTLEGWNVETVGDDIAWMKPARPARDQPEAGFLDVAPGTSPETNRNAIATVSENLILGQRAPDDGDVWWEGLTRGAAGPPDRLARRGLDAFRRQAGSPPNARFTTLAEQCPSIAAEWEDPPAYRSTPSCSAGAERRSSRWSARRSTGSTASSSGTMSSETAAAAAGQVGQLRFDPFAMLPFCGYNMAEYFSHWLDIGVRARHARGSSTSTGSARTTTASSSGPASVRTAACWPGSSAAATTPRRRSIRRSAASRRRARSRWTAWGWSRAARGALAVDEEAVKAELPQVEEHPRASATSCPGRSATSSRPCRSGW